VPEHSEVTAPAPATDISVPLVSLRHDERAQLVQKFQHAVPAVMLLGAGVQGLMHGEQGFAFWLAVGELAVSGLLLRTLAKEIAAARRPRHGSHAPHAGHHHGVDWFDIFAAGVLTAEALEHWHVHHHLPRPTLLTAAVTLALGLFHGRLAAHRRVLRIDAAGIRIRGRSFFRRFSASWQDIERIDLEEGKARIVLHSGRERRLHLKDFPNAPEVRDALRAAQERLAVLRQDA
jgi:hypothetical protein